jgi:hypothetical protein
MKLNPEKQLLEEEKDKLLADIREKAKRKKKLMKPHDKYDDDNELLK